MNWRDEYHYRRHHHRYYWGWRPDRDEYWDDRDIDPPWRRWDSEYDWD